MTKQGVDPGQTSVALHCRACEGLVRHPDGSLQKRFGKTDVLVPVERLLKTSTRPTLNFLVLIHASM
jgi:5'-3' exoribonuclease 1